MFLWQILKREYARQPAGSPGGIGGQFAPTGGSVGTGSVPKKDSEKYIDSEDSTDALREIGIPVLRKMTNAERSIIRDYAINGHFRINDAAKKLAKGLPVKDRVLVASINILDKMFSKTQLPESRILYRGLEEASQFGKQLADRLDGGEELTAGTIIGTGAYMSTSIREKVGLKFRDRVMLKIRAKKGTPALFIGGTGLSEHGSEAEVLLPRQSKMMVRNVDVYKARTWDGRHVNYYTITVDLV